MFNILKSTWHGIHNLSVVIHVAFVLAEVVHQANFI